MERLRRALNDRGSRRLAVLFLDLDRFKEVNDRFGHATGDRLLQTVGERLRSCIRRSDTAARLAGDEFVVLLDPVGGPRDVAHIARKILLALRQPFALGGCRVQITAAIGACLSREKTTASRLIRKADKAMYAAKKRGGDSFDLSSS